jgi:NADPH2:quinone reductase
MRHIVVRAFGGPDQLTVAEPSEPLHPQSDQVLVDVEAAGINYIDVYHRNGFGPVRPPYTPGFEGVGRIREIGRDAERTTPPQLRVGQRVSWVDVPGSYASELLVAAARAIPIPDSFTTTQALFFQALTTQYLVTEYRAITPGVRVLVHSAAGGVGQLLVQWLKHLGAWVVGTTSTDAKASIVRAIGADAVVNYGNNYSFLDEVMEVTGGRGVDLAYDAIGAATLTTTLEALARGGTVVSYGRASGAAAPIDPGVLRERCLRLAGGTVFAYVADATELQRRAAEVIAGNEGGWLRMEEGTGYDLSAAAAAHAAIESRATHGKLFLTMYGTGGR